MWVAGIPDGARVIVQGQDFVREGQKVEAVAAAESPRRRNDTSVVRERRDSAAKASDH